MNEIPSYDFPFNEWIFNIRELNSERKSYNDTLPHKHNYYQFIYIDQGEGVHIIDGSKITLHNHSVHFLSPQQVHFLQISNNSTGYICSFKDDLFTHFNGTLQNLGESSFFGINAVTSAIRLDEKQNCILKSILQLMYEEYEENSQNKFRVICGYLNLVLSKLESITTNENRIEKEKLNNSSRIFSSFLDVLEANYKSAMKPSSYAEKLNITSTYLNRITKNKIDKTCTQLINERKIVEAKRLLRFSHSSIKEISYTLGFDTPSYFIKLFKKHESITPAQYRNNFDL